MSHSNYTRNILNIKDENITFEENCLELIKIKGVTTKVFYGKLTYTPTSCPNCGCIYEPNPETIIKYGFKKNCKIRVDKACGYNTILLLDKQKFFLNIVIQLLLLLLIMLIFINKFLIILEQLLF